MVYNIILNLLKCNIFLLFNPPNLFEKLNLAFYETLRLTFDLNNVYLFQISQDLLDRFIH